MNVRLVPVVLVAIAFALCGPGCETLPQPEPESGPVASAGQTAAVEEQPGEAPPYATPIDNVYVEAAAFGATCERPFEVYLAHRSYGTSRQTECPGICASSTRTRALQSSCR